MQLTGFDLFRYRVPLIAPLSLKGSMHYEREGLLLRLKSDNGTVGWGEAAPLPGFSRESLDEAQRHLLELRRTLLGWAVTPDWIEPEGVFMHHLEGYTLAPSARFGFELALWSLYATARKRTLPQLLTPKPRTLISLNGLLTGSTPEVLVQARQMRRAGYRAVKLKVGQGTVAEDVERVRQVSQVLGTDVALRLDANRAWRMDEAILFLQGVRAVTFDYIEEPLITPEALPELAEQYGVSIALDETLTEVPLEGLKAYRKAQAAILKPTLLGGLVQTMRLARRAQSLGITPVLSAAFETGIGMRGVLALAASVGEIDTPAGLDTYRWLADDVIAPGLDLQHGQVEVAVLLGQRQRIKKEELAPVFEKDAVRE